MNVLFVCNNAYNPGNGLSVAILNTIKRLKQHGVDARLMAVRNSDPEGDSKALAARIDWWIEHPEERNRYSQAYADAARRFDVDESMRQLIGMYGTALADSHK